MAAPITTCAAAGKHRGVRNGEVQSGNFKSENMWRRQDVFQCCTQVNRTLRKFEKKFFFFPKKKTSIIAIQSLKNVDCAILEKFVLLKGKNQRILVAVFFKRIISVNLEENLKNKISDFRLSNIIHFCYCTLFFHFLDQYVCMDVNFVWIISSFL
jgi:hypothetical protein